MTPEHLDTLIADKPGRESREATCKALAAAFRQVGVTLWVGGGIIGPDRVSGESPFQFGSDATVGLATVVQIGGELIAGAVSLLEEENLYGAAALLRQLVEVEYLAWAFAEDEAQATTWLRSSHEERIRFWRPGDLRKRSNGRFRSTDYSLHCEQGGHPTPHATVLLPEHARQAPAALWWLDLALHAASTWQYVEVGATRLGWAEHVHDETLTRTIENWRSTDPLIGAAQSLA